jgi:tetratricopeptide (TPR) repeat protein/tRNA A-37 threonylcarbamoyl transferase component Bud32
MPPDTENALSHQVDAAIAEYLDAVKRGTLPDLESFVAKHGEIATELREFLADHQAFGQAAQRAAVAISTDNAGRSTGRLATPRRASFVGPQRFGKFELLEEIARGGMGVVYKARQAQPDRIVALKMILAGQFASRQDVDRFCAEAHAAAALDHSSIVPIFEVGEHEGQHYFTMAFIEGQSLGQRLLGGPLPAKEAAQIIRDVALAVDYAHRHGVVHRDLKPANILQEADGRVRVTDFGLAKRQTDEGGLTHTGELLGTPNFMSPEQVAGDPKQIGTSSDVYSLGATLYALLSGRPPFQSASTVETLRQVVDQDPIPLRELDASISRDLETITHKCLDKMPHRRYASPSALTDDIWRFLHDQPIEAVPATAIDRFRKFARRNKGGLVATAIVVVALAVGAAVSIFQAVRATQAEAQAKASERSALSNARQATEVSKFLASLLASPNPFQSGRGITVAEVLDRAVSELDKKFADDQVTKAALLHAIGDSYRGMALYDRARSILEKAVEIRRRELGPEHPDTLASMASLVEATRSDEAIPLAEEVFERRKTALGPNHPDTLASMESLGHKYYCYSRYDEAASTLEEALKRQTAVLGRNHLDTAMTMVDLAGVYATQQRHDLCIPLDEEVIKSQIAIDNPDDPMVLAAHRDLATMYWWTNRQDDARGIWEKVLPRQMARMGADHPMTLVTVKSLALEYRRIARYQDSIAKWEELANAWSSKNGPNDANVIEAHLELARTYQAAGDRDKALIQANALIQAKPDYADALQLRSELLTDVAEKTKSVVAKTKSSSDEKNSDLSTSSSQNPD